MSECVQIAVGSTNPSKLQAVKEALAVYTPVNVHGFIVQSGVSSQPNDLRTVIKGATNRAQDAYPKLYDCRIAVGLERGIISCPHSGKYLSIVACVIFDGSSLHFGLSPAFQIPEEVMKFVIRGQEISKACFSAGITQNPKPETTDIIGILSQGRLTQVEQIKPAILCASIGVEYKLRPL